MSDFSDITLVSVTGLDRAAGAGYALALSLWQMNGARAVLFSPRRPDEMPPDVGHRAVARMNYHEYSWCILYALWRYVSTEYVLIVQDDGWVLDVANWRDDFLHYDYIGAPTHLAIVSSPQGKRWMGEFKWCHYLDQADHVVTPVLNGGFSLRSQRMLRALIDHPHIRYQLSPPDFVGGDPIEVCWSAYEQNEDVQLTAILREQLEAAGMRYAPLPVCRKFSLEFASYLDHDTDLTQLFGHHGRWRRLVSLDSPAVRYSVPQSTIEKAFREMDVARMLEQRGYRLECAPEGPQAD